MKKHEEAYLSLRREAWSKLAGSALCLGSGVVTPFFLPLGLYLAFKSRSLFGTCKYYEENEDRPNNA